MAQKVFSRRKYCPDRMINEITAKPEMKEGALPSAPALPSSNLPPPTSLAEAIERLDVETARRIQAEELLEENEERFRNLSGRVGKFLWISDPQTNELLFVSPGYEEVWARKREDSYRSPEQWTNSFK
jgi:PAS domain-containing protein